MNLREGQEVVCVSNLFPLIEKWSSAKQAAPITPKKGEKINIDEILGEFLRFNKYDTVASTNWWHHTRFRPVKYQEDYIESEELANVN